ncbi:MAG: hypothetical protein N3C62_06410 [Synergistetes bacterium]|nr:hypothetical protein [Synergistota bacterium]
MVEKTHLVRENNRAFGDIIKCWRFKKWILGKEVDALSAEIRLLYNIELLSV